MNRNAPYYQAAKAALINWNGMDPVEAQKLIETGSRAEIEAQTGAHGSVYDAANRLGLGLGLTGKDLYDFTREALGQTTETRMIDDVRERFQMLRNHNPEMADIMTADLLLEASDEVHKGWTGRNATPFFGKKDIKDQQYQYNPLELIGFKEVKSDLLFLRPLAEQIGINVDEELLKQRYDARVESYLRHVQEVGGPGIEGMGGPGIDTLHEYVDIVDNLENGQRVILSPEIASAWEYDQALVADIAGQVDARGIGADQELMEHLEDVGLIHSEDDGRGYGE